MSATDIAPTPTQEIDLPSERQQGPTLRQQVARMEHQFALAAPRGVEAAQIVRDVITAINRTPKLADCVPVTVLGGAMTAAQLGLRIGVGGLDHCWLLPYWDRNFEWTDETGRTRKGANVAQLILGYKGLSELAQRSGRIESLSMHTVHEHDHFDYEYGLNERLIHQPAKGERGEAVYYYAVARYLPQGHSFEVISKAEAEAHRDRYAPKNRDGKVVGPWRDAFDAMALKTCVRRLSKLMPKATDIAAALHADETVRVNLDPSMGPGDVELHRVEPSVVVRTPSIAHDFDADTLPEGGDES